MVAAWDSELGTLHVAPWRCASETGGICSSDRSGVAGENEIYQVTILR